MLYLASTSPRRRRLLRAADIPFEFVTPGPEEVGRGTPAEVAALRARTKARGALVHSGPGWVLGVDTVVECEGRELGKPSDARAARSMLLALAGREHRVHTAMCLVRHPAGEGADLEDARSARVRCSELTAGEVDAYVATGAWRGKAGGYGIQDREAAFMSLVEGELDTVVGLPVAALRELLQRAAESRA
jgi:septum formation protein